MTSEGGGGASFSARGPAAVAEPLGVDVSDGDASDGGALVVGEDGRNGGIDDEGDQEEEPEDREDGRRAEAKRGVELGLFHEGLDRVAPDELFARRLRAHYDRCLLRI